MDTLYDDIVAAIKLSKKTEENQAALAARFDAVEKQIDMLNDRLRYIDHIVLGVYDNLIRSAEGFIDAMSTDGGSGNEN